ncbi:methyl-accepting chemotaxis protein [Lachnospiraceae bacterium LCP25S3_G4]
MKKFKFKDAKLGTKLAIVLGTIIFVGFAMLNLFVVIYTGKALGASTDRELTGICNTNVGKVSAITDVCNSISDTINGSLKNMYSQNDAIVEDGPFVSKVNGKKLSQSRYDAENTILNTIWSAVSENDSIVGAGVFFEPNAFSPNATDYAPYVYKEEAEAKKVQENTYDQYKEKDYYALTKQAMSMSFSDAYVDSDSGIDVVTVSYPIESNGEFKGIILLDIQSTIFSIIDVKSTEYPSLYVNLINQNQNIMYSTHSDVIGKNFKDTVSSKNYEKISKNFDKAKEFIVETNEKSGDTIRYYTPISVGENTWWMQTAVLADEYNAVKAKMTIFLIIFAIVAELVLVAMIIILLKKLLKPLQEIESAATKMAIGNLHVNIAYESKDEIGSLADSMRVMMTRIKNIVEDLTNCLGELADGNFRIESKAEGEYIGDYEPLIGSLKTIISKLNNVLTEIKNSSEQVNSGADQVSSAAQALSQGATEQASSIEELSATMSEMTDKIKINAQKASEASNLSDAAGNEVVVSNDKMKEMSKAMEEITGKSKEIGKIIKTIDDIAFQTNILALNAAVEAARAGEAGKGFAVVADEVRNLAQKSAEAASNTTVLIEGTIVAVENGGKITEETANVLNSVTENAIKVTALIDEISTVSNEQADGIAQVTVGIEQISAVVQTNSATAEESAAASEELSAQANMMNSLVSQFNLKGVDHDTIIYDNIDKKEEPISYEGIDTSSKY